MEHEEFANVAIVAEKMTCDGARFSLPHMGDDLYFQNRNWVEDTLRAAGMTDEEITKAVSTAVISGGTKGARRLIDVWFCNGKAATIIGKANEQFARSCTEIQMKCFWAEHKRGDHEAFIDSIYYSKVELTAAFFRGKPKANSRRQSGHKGARIGNPGSDNHKVIYKGTNEKTGTEVHLRGRQLQRIKKATGERVASERKRNPKVKYWDVLTDDCAHYAAKTLMKSLRDAGIDVTKFFKGVSSISWEKPLGPDDTEALDAAQEAWYIQTVTARLERQRDMFETEE